MMKFQYYKIQINCKPSLRTEGLAICVSVKPVCRQGRQSQIWFAQFNEIATLLSFCHPRARNDVHIYNFIIFFVTILFPAFNWQK